MRVSSRFPSRRCTCDALVPRHVACSFPGRRLACGMLVPKLAARVWHACSHIGRRHMWHAGSHIGRRNMRHACSRVGGSLVTCCSRVAAHLWHACSRNGGSQVARLVPKADSQRAASDAERAWPWPTVAAAASSIEHLLDWLTCVFPIETASTRRRYQESALRRRSRATAATVIHGSSTAYSEAWATTGGRQRWYERRPRFGPQRTDLRRVRPLAGCGGFGRDPMILSLGCCGGEVGDRPPLARRAPKGAC